jgi:hypothetical protein
MIDEDWFNRELGMLLWCPSVGRSKRGGNAAVVDVSENGKNAQKWRRTGKEQNQSNPILILSLKQQEQKWKW